MNLFRQAFHSKKAVHQRLWTGGLGAMLMLMLLAPMAIALPQWPGRPKPQGNNGTHATAQGGASQARPTPPSNGSYVTERGGASRGCGGGAPIMGLVPTEEIERISPVSQRTRKSRTTGGYTSEARPSFWFHVPFEAEGQTTLEFVLQDSNDEDVYRTVIAPPSQAGLIKVTLPDSVAELAVEERYRWFLKAEFDCPDSGSLEVPIQQSKGWIERYEPEPDLMAQLAAASPEQQVQLYQDAGYWFDALDGLAELRLAEPDSAALREDWNQLFDLYKISEEAAQADLIDCCEAVVTN